MNKISLGFDKLKQKEQELKQKLKDKNSQLANELKTTTFEEYFSKFKGCYQLSANARKTCLDSHIEMLKKFKPIIQLNKEISIIKQDLEINCDEITQKRELVKKFTEGVVSKLIIACNNELKYHPPNSDVNVTVSFDEVEWVIRDEKVKFLRAFNFEYLRSYDGNCYITVNCKNMHNLLNIIEEAYNEFNE